MLGRGRCGTGKRQEAVGKPSLQVRHRARVAIVDRDQVEIGLSTEHAFQLRFTVCPSLKNFRCSVAANEAPQFLKHVGVHRPIDLHG